MQGNNSIMKEKQIQISNINLDELKKLIYDLQKRINDIESKECDCCTTDPLISTMEGFNLQDYESDSEYDFAAVLNFTNPNDRFPIPTCGGRKAIIFLDDATVYFQYHDQDNWIIVNITRCENFIN